MIFDTITSISTALGGAIGIVRISGSESLKILGKIFNRKDKNFESHRIYYGNILDGEKLVDEVLVSVMKAPKSYTCEDVVEINCHGGTRATNAVLEVALKNGARLAEPGEFTKRAFLNGRIDLTRAQAVIDIINAKTENAHNAAIRRLSGALYEKISNLRAKILLLIANIEVSIDYPEHDYEQDNLKLIEENIASLKNEIEKLIQSAEQGIILKSGIETVILGRPNVGKSSLMNVLLKSDRAIVTDVPGTTRDILTEQVNLGGIMLKLVDTAGIRETSDIVEQIGVDRAKESVKNAELVLVVLDGSSELENYDREILNLTKNKKTIIIVNKCDLEQKINFDEFVIGENPHVIKISAKSGENVEEISKIISAMFFNNEFEDDNDFLISDIRNKDLLIKANEKLKSAENALKMGITEDLISIDLTEGYGLLGEIIGESVAEDVIDKIFSEFCLGK